LGQSDLDNVGIKVKR